MTTVNGQNKTESDLQGFDKIEYLQSDKYERQGVDRIEAGLTQETAYKDEALKAKFDRANIKNDYVISEEEATIYNWSQEGLNILNDDVLRDGLVLRGVDRTAGPRNKPYPQFYIFPGQEFSSLYLPGQKKMFKEIDKNNNEIVSPTEILRYIKKAELDNYDNLVNDLSFDISQSEKHLKNKMKDVQWGKNLFLSFLAFCTCFCAFGSRVHSGKQIKKVFSIAYLMSLLTFGGASVIDVMKNNKKYESQIKESINVQDDLSSLKKQLKNELDYLDEQLKIENQDLSNSLK